ncbi:ankyrin repeat-containing domain protein [Hygrophoropsis aurantiaca]|uniref:Ankyrin repeat-containing domain protein n=1 Tax=Hygrophoropsis aurantiaca TaxID=72124 RepID=A0ACB8A5B3_9AGAM|nr:ankyrin repeat-containing domain protein [Hygrophoropsis aurantiaca]
MPTHPSPSAEEAENLLFSCRYGELNEIRQFVEKFGSDIIPTIQDENGNTVLHMICGNGHEDVLEYLLPLVPPAIIAAQNNALSTPLHWAALNQHLHIAQKLVQFPTGLGADLIDIKNAAGRSPLGEAENAGWEEGARWFVQMMKLDEGDVSTEANAEDESVGAFQDVEVEIEDAEGKIARMTLSGSQTQPDSKAT